jgi:hypothetical protein
MNVMPTHTSEGVIRFGRYDGNTSRYNEIQNSVTSTGTGSYMNLSVHSGTENVITDVMTLLGSGNVGIGTASPTNYKLEVDGNVKGDSFGNDENTTARIFAPEGAAYNGSGTQTGYLIIKLPDNGAGGINNMMSGLIRVFDYAGNESFDVHFAGYWYSGYNWTNCTAWIESQSNVDRNFNVRFGAMTGAAGSNTRPYITIGEGNSTWSYCKFSVMEYTSGHSNMNLYKWNSGWEMALSSTAPGVTARVNYNCQGNNWARNAQDLYYGSGTGNVGIGTPSPFSTAKLQVKTDTDRNVAIQTGTTHATGIKINAFNDAANTNIPLELNGSFLSLKTGEAEKMRIDSSGVTHIMGATASALNSLQFSYNSTAGSAELSAKSNGGNTSFEFYTSNSGTSGLRMSIGSTGRILFKGLDGKTQVHPDVSYRTSDGELFYQTSSERYKTNIVNLENCLDKVNSLRTVRFTDTNTNEPGFGLIAEETNEIIPEVVFTKDEQIEGISYSNLTPFLIKAIQELKADNDSLKARIETLENN